MKLYIPDMPEEKRVSEERVLSRTIYGLVPIVLIYIVWAWTLLEGVYFAK